MPLSDAARALLARRKAGQTPPEAAPEVQDPAPEAAPAVEVPAADAGSMTLDVDDGLTDDERYMQGARDFYRAQDKAAKAAKVDSSDSAFWFALCFWDEKARTKFIQRHGLTLTLGRYASGEDFAAAVNAPAEPPSKEIARKRKLGNILANRARTAAQAAAHLSAKPLPHYLEHLPEDAWTNHAERDVEMELGVLMQAFRDRASSDYRPLQVTDSPHWIAIHCHSREAKYDLLGRTGLDALGNRYLDGHAADEILSTTTE